MAKGNLDFYVFQLERGDDTGNLHYQGYFECRTMFMTTLKRFWAKNADNTQPHFEQARADSKRNYEYCTKPNDAFPLDTIYEDSRGKEHTVVERIDGPWSAGTQREEIKLGSGLTKTFLKYHALRTQILQGESPKRIWLDNIEIALKHGSNVKELTKLVGRNREVKRKPLFVIALIGTPGIGKTVWIRQYVGKDNPQAWWKPSEAKRWEGYHGQDITILDENPRECGIPIGEFLKVVNRAGGVGMNPTITLAVL